MRSVLCHHGDGAYVVSDVVVVGGLDQVAEEAVDLELGSGDRLLAVESSLTKQAPENARSKQGLAFPAGSGWSA